MSPSRVALRVLGALAVVGLPLLAWGARAGGWPGAGNVLSLAVVAAALVALWRTSGPLAAALVAALLAAAGAAWRLAPVYWPPVAINLAMAALFAASLRDDPLITRFARHARGSVNPQKARYCRRLTAVWALWLLLLAATGAAIARSGDERLGAWWSGVMNYALIALLFVGERLYRRLRGHAPESLVDQARSVRHVLRERRG